MPQQHLKLLDFPLQENLPLQIILDHFERLDILPLDIGDLLVQGKSLLVDHLFLLRQIVEILAFLLQNKAKSPTFCSADIFYSLYCSRMVLSLDFSIWILS